MLPVSPVKRKIQFQKASHPILAQVLGCLWVELPSGAACFSPLRMKQANPGWSRREHLNPCCSHDADPSLEVGFVEPLGRDSVGQP